MFKRHFIFSRSQPAATTSAFLRQNSKLHHHHQTSFSAPLIFSAQRFQNANKNSSGSVRPVEKKNFIQYSEIDLPTSSRIDHIRSKHMHKNGHEWVAMEKVHGTNFGVYLLDGSNLRFAKRSGIMHPDENFFGYHVMEEDFRRWMTTVARLVKLKYGFEEQRVGAIIMNGELFGAKYDHPGLRASDSKKREAFREKYGFDLDHNGKSKKFHIFKNIIDPKTKMPLRQDISKVAIQEEEFPQYSPELHYFCFDIKYSVKGAVSRADDKLKPDGTNQWEDLQLLPYDDFLDICQNTKLEHPDFIYAKPLVRGTLDECLTFDVEHFETPLPAQIGLGDFTLKNNLAEGVVIKHVKRGDPVFDKNAEMMGVSSILKLRSGNFMELKHSGKAAEMRDDYQKIRDKALKATGGKESRIDANSAMTELHAQANEILINHVSEGRLNNVVSKVGKQVLIDGELDKNTLALMLAKDAIKDFLKDVDDPEGLTVGAPISVRRMLAANAYYEAVEVVKGKWAELTKPMVE